MSTLENIIKQGYLKKGNSGGNRLSGWLRKIEGQKWFVFTIRQSVPYLEYYDSNTEVFTQRPANSYCLSQCRRVNSSLGRNNPLTFNIVCSDRVIELNASSRSQMLDWVNDIERTLTRLGILKREAKEEHVYSSFPAVTRRTRVSQAAAEERGLDTTRSSSSLDTNPSSSLQSNEQPPPVPQRPLVFLSNAEKKPEKSPVTDPKSAENYDLDYGGAAAAAAASDVHCSNDSDFVSWDEVMRVRESFLLKNRMDTKTNEEVDSGWWGKGGATSIAQNDSESSCEDVYGLSEETYSKPEPRQKDLLLFDDSLDLTVLPNSSSQFPRAGSDSDLSIGLMGHDNTTSQVEDNEYSLLPSALMGEVPDQTDKDEETIVRPVPMPRRALSLRSYSRETQDLTNGVDPEESCSGTKGASLHPVEEEVKMEIKQDTAAWSQGQSSCSDFQVGNLLGKENEIPNHIDLEHDNSEMFQNNKDENANFYDKDDSTSHCVLAPPTIPPRCDSLAGWTPPTLFSTQSNQDFPTELDFYSHPISLSTVQGLMPQTPHTSNVMSIPAIPDSSFSDKENSPNPHPAQQPPAIPPLPLPRRKTINTTSSPGAFYSKNKHTFTSLDVPPQIPRRTLPKSASLPDDTPPQLPFRNPKPKLTASFSFSDNDDKAKLLDDNASIASAASVRERDRKSVTLAASTAGSRQSGLAKKMLLDRANSLHTVVSLKQTQAEILQTEIDKGHVSVTLTQKSGHGLALVDWNGMPCVAGWNQKDFPSLHGKLHFGDMLISVNHVRVSSSEMAQKLLRHAPDIKIEVTLERMPHAKVFAIRRSAEGQSLGLKREGGTGEILYVDPNGLAADHGLPQYAPGTMGKTRCTWFLTEINSRPLNLFFKENEIEHLLYAVGREISIVVQPSDFVLEIRRGLKKLKNYKNFLTQ